MAALDELNAVVFKWADMNGSTIKPKLTCDGQGTGIRWWRLQLVEKWQTVDDAGNHVGSSQLDRCVKWTDEKLEDWPSCKRMAWDMWDFKHRKDAEKFITVFHLSWQQ
jgi:hypothetical protein